MKYDDGGAAAAHLKTQKRSITEECIDPLGRYLVRFDTIKKQIAVRKDRMLEYDFRRNKVKKMNEKPPKDPIKLPMAKEKMSKAKEEYEEINLQVTNGIISVLEDKCIAYDPAIKTVSISCLSVSAWT